ncbi:hypothetical protein ONE63_005015 [Megalurothrips usitatus]|uniref:Peptidase S1 domain-containing protein n=1 Tax=Megalurothrips usitatus TaxID=439358 RepID=A0AAV7X1J1_9NEOP|nr:hypothetical protein ONE63_005015 [Megalurothrips usitatus]
MIRVHEDYGATKLQFTNDIALVELAQEVDITAWALPVCVDWGLTQPELRDGEEGTVIGFGGLSESPSEELKFARLPFVHADTCRKHVNNKLAVFSVLPDKFCVGSVNRTTVGKGDSGGGLAFPDKDRQWFLRGVVSVGSPQEATYSFFSDVSGRRCGVDVSETSVTDGKLARLQDFPWEVDVYFREPSSSTFERLWTGILVKPNLVITVWKHKEWHFRTRDLADIPVTALRIAARKHSNSVDIEKATYVSEVVQTFAPYEEREQTGMDYNVILLELKQPLNLMPVCVDWTGSALVSMKKYGIVSANYQGNTSCKSTILYKFWWLKDRCVRLPVSMRTLQKSFCGLTFKVTNTGLVVTPGYNLGANKCYPQMKRTKTKSV